MDIIRFTGPEVTEPSGGEFVQGISSIMWVERYFQASECTITAPVSSDLRRLLPEGSLISHMNTDLPMIVTTHKIDDQDEAEPNIVITGYGFETILEQRLVGADDLSTSADALSNEFLGPVIPAGYSWDAARNLINRCTYAPEIFDDGNAIPNIVVWQPDDLLARVLEVGYTPEYAERKIPIGDLYKEVMELLGSDNIGFSSTWRPWLESGILTTKMRLTMNKGLDLSGEVVFSHDYGDISGGEYLWSIDSNKNAVMVVGRWVSAAEDSSTSAEGYARRWMMVDGSDIDGEFTEAPTGSALTTVTERMRTRARDTIKRQRSVALAQAQATAASQRWTYRKDYNLGDLVTVEGDYDETRRMMVVEHVEMEDENGESSYPTFAPT